MMHLQTRKFSFYRFQLPAIIFTIMIFINSSYSGIQPFNLGFDLQDKLYHFVFYMLYAIVLARAFYHQKRFVKINRHFVIATIIFGALYGVSDEIHQYFVPGRFMDIWDMFADILGVIAGAGLYYFLQNIIFSKIISENAGTGDSHKK